MIRVDKACLMLAREEDGQLQLTLSNPENEPAEVEVVVSVGTTKPTEHRLVIRLPDGHQGGGSVTKVTPIPGG